MEERQRREEEERKKREEEEGRKLKELEVMKKKELERGGQLTTYKALYSFVARNADELSIDANCLIQVRKKLL